MKRQILSSSPIIQGCWYPAGASTKIGFEIFYQEWFTDGMFNNGYCLFSSQCGDNPVCIRGDPLDCMEFLFFFCYDSGRRSIIDNKSFFR